MYPIRFKVSINVRSTATCKLLRCCDLIVVATSPQRVMGHRAVWEARSRLIETLKAGTWYLETDVRPETQEVRNAEVSPWKTA